MMQKDPGTLYSFPPGVTSWKTRVNVTTSILTLMQSRQEFPPRRILCVLLQPPPLPCTLETTELCGCVIRRWLLCKRNHILWAFWNWLFSHSVNVWKSIQVVVSIICLLLKSIPWHGYTIDYLSIHSPAKGRGLFPVFPAIRNRAVVNIGVQAFIFLGQMPRSACWS